MADAGLPSNVFELPDTIEAIEYYYEQGMTDGLPVIPAHGGESSPVPGAGRYRARRSAGDQTQPQLGRDRR